MKLEDGQIITLDNDKDYVIVKQVLYEETNYLYLMTARKPLEVLVTKLQNTGDNQKLVVVDSEEELKKIVNLFEK